MDKEKALNFLRSYRDELQTIRSRLMKADASNPFGDDDNKRYHHVALKLKDFSADHLMDNRRTSFELVRKFTGSMSATSGLPTPNGMAAYIESLSDLVERIEATPFILKKTPNPAAGSAKPTTVAAVSTQAEDQKTTVVAPLEKIAKRFHLVERQLRENAPPVSGEDEYEQRVLNVFHALLLLHYEHVEKEQWAPAYAEEGTVISFYMPDQRMVAEISKPPKSLSTDDIRKRLAHHIEKHQSHPECDAIYCYVYDPINRIHDNGALEKALNDCEGETKVCVRVIPRD